MVPRRIVCLLFAVFLLHLAPAANRTKDLSPHYRHWIKEEVAYIISSDERKQFLDLHTDAEREQFIRAFWQERNPNPESQVNSYEEEHYRRLAYANGHFGTPGADNGWQTDQGRIYITLGAPKQQANYRVGRNVRPMLIWFYQNASPALPPYFYIVFYKRSAAEPYELYSPTMDGPTKLVTTMRGMNDPQRCLDIIRNSLGDEVARTVVSLIPGEPVDLKKYAPTMTSDAMLDTIEGLADNPITLHLLTERRATNVTSTIFYGGDEPDLETAIFRDGDDRMTVSYLFHLPKPDPALIGSLPNGKFGYRVTLNTEVLTSRGEPIYNDQQVLTRDLTEAEIRSAKTKLFGAEGRLPLAPGKYSIIVTLTNDLNHAGYRQHAVVTVPHPQSLTWNMSSLVAFSPAPPVRASQLALPFSIEGVRFVPTGVQRVRLHHGDTLRFAFQLWDKPADPAALAGSKIRLHYAYGPISAGVPQQETEEINGGDFDAEGNLLTGHTISTEALAPGSYRLVVTATNESTNQNAYAAMMFEVVEDSRPTGIWTVYDTPAASKQTEAQDDYKRGLSAVSSGEMSVGVHWFREALDEAPGDPRIISHLAECYAATDQEVQLAALSHEYSPTRDLDTHTAVLMAHASATQGDAKYAKHILEFELQFQPPSVELYSALAETYQQLGETAKAQEFWSKMAKL